MRPMRRAHKPTNFVCWLSWYLGSQNFWNPQGLFRPVRGLTYIY